jgi:hypothetical protein
MRRAGAVLRLASLIAVLAALGLRLLSPPGWMPNPDGASRAWLVICTGHGPLGTPGERSGAPVKQKAQSDRCAFAVLAHALPAAPLATLRAERAAVQTSDPWPAEIRLVVRDRWRAGSARGPPAFA